MSTLESSCGGNPWIFDDKGFLRFRDGDFLFHAFALVAAAHRMNRSGEEIFERGPFHGHAFFFEGIGYTSLALDKYRCPALTSVCCYSDHLDWDGGSHLAWFALKTVRAIGAGCFEKLSIELLMNKDISWPKGTWETGSNNPSAHCSIVSRSIGFLTFVRRLSARSENGRRDEHGGIPKDVHQSPRV